MYINSCIHSDGISLNLFKEKYTLEYLKKIWRAYPRELKNMFLNHMTFLSTIHLPFFLDEHEIQYNSSRPYFHSLFKKLMRLNIPYFADVDAVPSKKYYSILNKSRYLFNGASDSLPEYTVETDGSSIIGFTFGKESLINYGLCEELGIKTHLLYFEEDDPFDYYENKHKRRLARSFTKKHAPIPFIKNTISLLRFYEHFNAPQTQVGWTRLLTEYTLMSLPPAYAFNSEYILFGNEKSCDDYYISSEGHQCNPSFDQSTMWTSALDKLTRTLTDGNVSTVSPVRPLHELAIIKILHQRYPELGRYQMSCFTDDDYGKADRWCHHCTKCARNYIMLLAAGVNPKKVDFREDMMNKKYAKYYAIFPEKTEAVTVYDETGLGRDEQLLAFLLAYENNAKGALITRFKREYLKEARTREDELYARFLKVCRDRLPKAFSDARSIYREELTAGIPSFN